ncbi:NYN domain-containing protein [Caloranaerobacter ferrireducens]|uniref:NYN domain-containing protein n=1 Tax=Caloranaerobacter ferrireducens TaxID=1323370 RepID=UPI00084D64B8|nr:NYN domain-containing protein [Caloranaerobacter ferrireducens]
MTNEKIIEIKEKVKEQNVQNVGIFVDFDNIYYGLRDFAINLNDENYCIFKMLNDIYEKDRIRTMRAYADFDQVNGIKLKSLQEKRVQIRNVYGNGREEKYRKNASDIELSIDAIETYYKNENIDTYVFVTADSDMIPIMSRMMYKGKKVHLYYIDENRSQYQNITNYAHLSEDILTIFNISLERKKPEYWLDDVINIINQWYNNPKNNNKLLGGKWLNQELQEKLFMSHNLASNVIQYLEENEYIKKVSRVLNDKNIEGYILNSKNNENVIKMNEKAV